MTNEEIKAALDSISKCAIGIKQRQGGQRLIVLDGVIEDNHFLIISDALQSQLTKSDENVTCGGASNVPEGFRLSPEQDIVWNWAAAHGLTLVADECNDLLWRLEEAAPQVKAETVDFEDLLRSAPKTIIRDLDSVQYGWHQACCHIFSNYNITRKAK